MKAERIGAFIVLLLGGGYLWEAAFMEEANIGDPLGPQAFPIILGVVMTGLGITLAIKPASSSAPFPSYTSGTARAVTLVFMLAAYIFGLEMAGYPIATFAFLVLASRLLGEKSWLTTVLVPLAVSAGIFALFTRVLTIPLPLGFIKQLME